MLDQIKIYANAILAVCLLAGLSYSHYYSWSHGKAAGEAVVQAKFDSYRNNINDQVQIAKSNAALEKQKQEREYEKAKFDYNNVSRDLDVALARLRKSKTVPREGSMPVAGIGSGTVPTETKDTSRVIDAPSFRAGTFRSVEDFYDAALKDTAQCKKLIEVVR